MIASFRCLGCGELNEVQFGWAPPNEDVSYDITIAHACACSHRYDLQLYGTGEAPRVAIMGQANLEVTLSVLSSNRDEYFDKFAPSLDPLEVFTMTAMEINNLIDRLSSTDPTSSINRMLFIQIYSAIEACLCDLLLGVAHIRKVQVRLFGGWKSLREERFSLETIAAQWDLPQKRLVRFLRDRQYHDFDEVNALYVMATGHTILPEEAPLAELRQSVAVRHDCVHRNGREKGDGALRKISQASLYSLLEVMRSVARKADAATREAQEEYTKSIAWDDQDLPF